MKISVCLATYNGEYFIKKQLGSIISQLSPDDEIIISDDSSTDNTVAIIEEIMDSRVKIFKNNKFHNPVFNFENALKYATGDLIFLSDQDDEWKENKIFECVKLLKQYDLVISDCQIMDENGGTLYPSFFNLKGSRKGFLKNLISNSYIGCCMAFNRNILSKALPFPKNTYMHDWWIGLVAELSGRVYFTEKKLITHYRHGTNFSTTGSKSKNNLAFKVKIRIALMLNLIRRIFFPSLQKRKIDGIK